MDSVFSLKDKVAIITGARRGIGKAISLLFATAEADIAVCDLIEGSELESVAEGVYKLGRKSLSMQVDISKKNDVEDMVKKVLDKFGKIDILVNNAGLFNDKIMMELPENEWDHILDVNLKGYYLCSQAVGKEMIKQKKGGIINMASRNAVQVEKGRGAYCISKAGVVMLTRVLARELGEYNIRVNAIGPGLIETEMTQEARSMPDFMEQLRKVVPLGRTAKPEEIAYIALFLASEASNYVTGHMILADGGRGA